MIRHEVSEAHVDWVEHMLVDKTLIDRHGDTTIEDKPVKGCPQEGVFISIFVVPRGKRSLKDLQQEGFMVYDHADDIVRENFRNILRDCMINALKTVQRLCETKGLTLNPLKTNVMVFTRKWKPKPIKPEAEGEKKLLSP